MYHKFEKMLKMKKDNGDGMDDVEKEAKMGVLESLKRAAMDEMGDKLKGLKKVTVASNDEEGLKEGLSHAKDVIEHGDSGMGEDSPEVDQDEEHDAIEEPDMQDEGVEAEHNEEHEGDSEDEDDEDFSPEGIDQKIEKLKQLKAKLHNK